MQHDISLDEVLTVEELLGGEYVHDTPPDSGALFAGDEPEFVPGRWEPRCLEAETAIRKGIAVATRSQVGMHKWRNREEAYVEVITKLGLYLRKQYRGSGPFKITNMKFLRSTNRAGWLNLFAQNTTRGWVRKRTRDAKKIKAVKEGLQRRIIPVRVKLSMVEDKTPKFDLHQFAGKVYIPPIQFDDALVSGDDERTALIKEEIAKLPPADQEFFEWYVFDHKTTPVPPVQRKRFERLKGRFRTNVTKSLSLTI